MSDRASPAVMAALRDTLQNQMDASDPPETAMTFARLRSEGLSEDETWRWLSAAMLQELNAMVRDNRLFDRRGYFAALNQLPGLEDR